MVAVIPLGAPSAGDVARRLSGDGFTVVLVADEATAGEAGRLAAELPGPGRAAVYVGLDGLAESVRELFGERRGTG